jgi:putative oxidoreductase
VKARLSRIPSAPGLAALVLRVTVGAILLAHGLAKLQGGVAKFAGFVESLGIPLPTPAAYATVTIETLGGAMLLIGLGTRLWAALATLLMVGTTLVVKLDAGLLGAAGRSGMELDLLILAGSLAVVLIGPGPISLDHVLGVDPASSARSRVGRAPAPPLGTAPDEPVVTIALDEATPAASERASEKS